MVKRFFDIIASLCGLVLLAPLFMVVGILIKLDAPGPVFFRQKRIGKNGMPFEILKFRTMISDSSGPRVTVSGDSRVTAIGQLIRKTKIDELPQLINVLKCDMSLVGPRPEVADFVEKYSPEEKKVLAVRPGITDYASLSYFDEEKVLKDSQNVLETYEKVIMPHKLKLNLEYISRQSLLLDICLILKTIQRIFINPR